MEGTHLMAKKQTASVAVAPQTAERLPANKNSFGVRLKKSFIKYNWLYVFLIPTVLFYILFCYVPMGGIIIAFKKYTGALSIWESKWVGLKWFKSFFGSYYAAEIIGNTLRISFYSLATFPIPIILALMLNEIQHPTYKKICQTVMYAPHFISVVVMVSMINLFFHPSYGFINNWIAALGGERVEFLTNPEIFPHLYVWSGVWQGMGWGCIVYVAALSAVDPALHEAATLDGASRLQRILHINIPTILPTIIIMLILNTGSIMSVGGDKVLLMLNDLNREKAEVISTFVYNRGLVSGDYSYAAAVDMFTNIVNMTLLLTVNWISGKVSETSLF